MTVADLSKDLRVSSSFVRALCTSGELRARKVRGAWSISATAYRDLLRAGRRRARADVRAWQAARRATLGPAAYRRSARTRAWMAELDRRAATRPGRRRSRLTKA